MNENIFWLGINIYHEARGESVEGQVAVCHVVLNRAEKHHRTAKKIILQPMQFSWHNNNTFPALKDYTSLFESFKAAEIAVAERLNGEILGGADHYFADTISQPSWAANMKFIKQIGHHKFFKE